MSGNYSQLSIMSSHIPGAVVAPGPAVVAPGAAVVAPPAVKTLLIINVYD